MAQQKESNEGTVPCLVCRGRYNYLTSGHLSSPRCKPGRPADIASYRVWVSKQYDIDMDDPIFQRNQIQNPENYAKHAERLGLPK